MKVIDGKRIRTYLVNGKFTFEACGPLLPLPFQSTFSLLEVLQVFPSHVPPQVNHLMSTVGSRLLDRHHAQQLLHLHGIGLSLDDKNYITI